MKLHEAEVGQGVIVNGKKYVVGVHGIKGGKVLDDGSRSSIFVHRDRTSELELHDDKTRWIQCWQIEADTECELDA